MKDEVNPYSGKDESSVLMIERKKKVTFDQNKRLLIITPSQRDCIDSVRPGTMYFDKNDRRFSDVVVSCSATSAGSKKYCDTVNKKLLIAALRLIHNFDATDFGDGPIHNKFEKEEGERINCFIKSQELGLWAGHPVSGGFEYRVHCLTDKGRGLLAELEAEQLLLEKLSCRSLGGGNKNETK